MTFREQMDAYQFQCCLNVYYDMDACELEIIAQDENADPVYREAARVTLAAREAESETLYTVERQGV